MVCRRYAERSKAILLCVFAPGEDDGRSTEVAVGAIAGRWKRRCGWAGSGDRVVEVVVRGTRTEGCEAGQFDVAGGAWSERHAHRSRQLLKRKGVSSCHDYGGGGDGLRRCGGWARRPSIFMWVVGKIPGLRMRGTGWSVRV